MDGKRKRQLLAPFTLTAVLIGLDQATKAMIQRTLTVGEKIEVMGDFFWLWHVRNRGMAFSLGSSLPDGLRSILFLLLPVVVLGLLVIYYFRTTHMDGVQRWCLAAILGGGLSNLIDRFIRPGGVVDFLSFKFYGLFGLERYPTFNLADSSIVVAGIVIIVFYIISQRRRTLNE